MSEPRGPSPAGILATIGVLAAAVLCCAGPALLAGGALSGIGGVLRSPWLIGIGALLIVGSLGYTLLRRVGRRGEPRDADESCCPPQARPKPGLDNRPTQPHDPARNDRVEKRAR